MQSTRRWTPSSPPWPSRTTSSTGCSAISTRRGGRSPPAVRAGRSPTWCSTFPRPTTWRSPAPSDASTTLAGFGKAGESAPAGADVDELAALAVAAERGLPGKEVYERWRASSTAQVEGARRLASPAPGCRGSPASWRPSRWPPPAWPRCGSTPATSPTAWAAGWHPARTSGRSPAWPGGRCPTPSPAPARRCPGPSHCRSPLPTEPGSSRPTNRPATTVTGPALDFCLVAARRADPSETALTATGPDAAAVLELVRTFA